MVYCFPIFLPLLSFLLVALFGKKLQDRGAQWLSTALLILAAFFGAVCFYEVAIQGKPVVLPLFDWLSTPYLTVVWSLKFDALSSIMVVVVTSVSAMVHLYSIGYMHHDSSVPRFMAYLSLFTFFMLMLVTASNLLQLFFGWEGVGLASYLLIGFWYEKDAANKAAMKAFVVNRVGDVSFALGLLLIYRLTGSLDFHVIFAKMDLILGAKWNGFGCDFQAVTVIALLLLGGAMGKSAQLGLHVWLPDAMEGPTPVSALIHAATMVTAGVFMLVRMSPLLEHSDLALMVIACVGAATAFFAGTVAITQHDIKRVIAYSTCSQLGYMFFAVGVSAYHAAIFHLFTHAFFKALLFLGAGSVIHAMSDEQDMRKMGGIWRSIPVTYAMMWIGTLALTGFPFLSGYYSKDLILESVLASSSGVGPLVYGIGIISAVLTAAYSWRLLFLTFHGKARSDERVLARVHESPAVMIVPLIVLAAGSIGAGQLGFDLFVGGEKFWADSLLILPSHDTLAAIHHLPTWAKYLPILAGILGFSIAAWLYLRETDAGERLVTTFGKIHSFLYHKWYVDELYQRVLITPTWRLGKLLWKGDWGLIDRFLPDGMAKFVQASSKKASLMQTGYAFQYAIVMLVGIVILTLWQLLRTVFIAHV